MAAMRLASPDGVRLKRKAGSRPRTASTPSMMVASPPLTGSPSGDDPGPVASGAQALRPAIMVAASTAAAHLLQVRTGVLSPLMGAVACSARRLACCREQYPPVIHERQHF